MRSPWGNSYATCDDANYHAIVYQGIAPSVKAERVAELKKAWADDGCHPSQVQRRKDENWPKRWALMNAATGSGLGVGQYRHGASHRELQPGPSFDFARPGREQKGKRTFIIYLHHLLRPYLYLNLEGKVYAGVAMGEPASANNVYIRSHVKVHRRLGDASAGL